MLTKENINNILKNLNLKDTDTIMIHSSLKSIGEIEGRAEGLLDTLKKYFKNGLILLPCHTWNFMNQDFMNLDLDEENSCVGVLSNIALRNGFIRSPHPTHSVVAYGNYASNYILKDIDAKTPVSPFGCFGSLKERDSYILFLGAPLSKNTFIHSIEEEFNVPDRFTDKKYHLFSHNKTNTYEFNIYKHYCSFHPHISENYAKLYEPLKELNILKEFKFGNALSYIINVKECYKYVSNKLKENIHYFDTLK